jgi:hypothetical protein
VTVKRNLSRSAVRLAKGQVWKLRHIYIEIVDLGKRLLQYRMLDSLEQQGVRPQSSETTVMWRYLRTRNAHLYKVDGSGGHLPATSNQ